MPKTVWRGTISPTVYQFAVYLMYLSDLLLHITPPHLSDPAYDRMRQSSGPGVAVPGVITKFRCTTSRIQAVTALRILSRRPGGLRSGFHMLPRWAR